MKLPWTILSFIAVLSFSIMVTLITYISKKGIPVSFILLGVAIVLFLFYTIQLIISGGMPKITASTIIIVAIIGILSAIGNLAQFEAAKMAPNPGLPITIVGFHAALVAVIAYFLFGNKLTPLQIVGMITALVGVSLISLSGK